MASTIEETTIAQKTRELCQAILDEPSVKRSRQHIDNFMADEKTRAQYDDLIAKGQALQQKQQSSTPLTGDEISHFEQNRDTLFEEPRWRVSSSNLSKSSTRCGNPSRNTSARTVCGSSR